MNKHSSNVYYHNAQTDIPTSSILNKKRAFTQVSKINLLAKELTDLSKTIKHYTESKRELKFLMENNTITASAISKSRDKVWHLNTEHSSLNTRLEKTPFFRFKLKKELKEQERIVYRNLLAEKEHSRELENLYSLRTEQIRSHITFLERIDIKSTTKKYLKLHKDYNKIIAILTTLTSAPIYPHPVNVFKKEATMCYLNIVNE